MLTNASATPGDRVVLTKPIVNGILATAMKRGSLDSAASAEMISFMVELNAQASDAARAVGARCATDVTGFGLTGHASHIARASGVTLAIRANAVPILSRAREAWLNGARPGGGDRNLEFANTLVQWNAVAEVDRALLTDPQTSGGLLVAVPAPRLADYLARVPRAVEIGEVLPRGEAAIVVT